MREKYNWKTISAGLTLFIVGTASVLVDFFYFKSTMNLGISIGCSLIASALVILFQSIFLERVKENPLDEWGIEQIFLTRAEMNVESAPFLYKAKYKLDIIAFGLKSLRDSQTEKIENCLKRGVNIRIMTMHPSSPYVSQREKEEECSDGYIKNSIEQLVNWAAILNSKNYKGKIVIKGYNCMTLDFYWRVDDNLYVGPYWYGIQSQPTITYKFATDKKGFSTYEAYFEKLWNDSALSTSLLDVKQKDKKAKKLIDSFR